MFLKTFCFALDLRNDPELIKQYRDMHAPGVPPALVTESIRDAGITSMKIFLCGNRLFMLMETIDSYSAEAKASADAASPAVQAWEQEMWRFQQALPWAKSGEKWLPTELIYDLAQQPLTSKRVR